MHPWLETLVAVLISATAFMVGYHFRRACWISMGIGVLGIGAALLFGDYLSRRQSGYLMCLAVPLVTAPLLRYPISRITSGGLLAATLIAVVYSGWMEFIGPAISRNEVSQLKTRFSQSGICMQGTGYTCGPAAAVTALRRLSFPAEESEIGLLSYCSHHTGTYAQDLAEAMVQKYGGDGLKCSYQVLDDLKALRDAGLALTVIELEPGSHHWVTVLEVTDQEVKLGDPLNGLRSEPLAVFQQHWDKQTIKVWR